ncbi:7977_t:CDS:1, partial [Racocetra fulgida]
SDIELEKELGRESEIELEKELGREIEIESSLKLVSIRDFLSL